MSSFAVFTNLFSMLVASAAAPAPKGPTFWMPKQGSTVAPQVDGVFDFITWLSIFFFVLIVALLVIFSVKYHKPKGTLAEGKATHNTPLELTWTIIPLLLVIAIFYVGMKGYINLRVAPESPYEVQVIGQKWQWTFEHPNGGNEAAILKVPAGRPVRLVMTSTDVLHSFYIPDFRVKQDVVPGRYTTLWFEAIEPGEYDFYCAEYCGKDHSNMFGRVEVYDPAEFEQVIYELANAWKELDQAELIVYAGEKLYNRCQSCHSMDGTTGTGPSYVDVWQRARAGTTVFTDGTTLQQLYDNGTYLSPEDYLLDSILNPQRYIVQGFTGSMPTFKGQLQEPQMRALIGFLKNIDKFDAQGKFIGNVDELREQSGAVPSDGDGQQP